MTVLIDYKQYDLFFEYLIVADAFQVQLLWHFGTQTARVREAAALADLLRTWLPNEVTRVVVDRIPGNSTRIVVPRRNLVA